jgi:hypothetical protein
MKNNFKLTLYLKNGGVIGILTNNGKTLPVSVSRSFKDDEWIYSAVVTSAKYAGSEKATAKKLCKEQPSIKSMIDFLNDANEYVQYLTIDEWSSHVLALLKKKLSYQKSDILMFD